MAGMPAEGGIFIYFIVLFFISNLQGHTWVMVTPKGRQPNDCR